MFNMLSLNEMACDNDFFVKHNIKYKYWHRDQQDEMFPFY